MEISSLDMTMGVPDELDVQATTGATHTWATKPIHQRLQSV